MHICFALDNTLNDREGAVEAWIAEFLAAHGRPASEAVWLRELDADGYRPRAEAFTQIRERYDLPETVDQLVASYRTRVIELSRLVPGALECLAGFRQAGWTIVILTNGSSGQQHAKLDRLDIRDHVDAVIVSDDLGIKKPDEQIFVAAADVVGMVAQGAWMVGDAMLHDIVGGTRCGMHTAWIRRGRNWDSSLGAAPTVTIDRLGDLQGSIENQTRR